MNIEKEIELHYQDETSNKLYKVFLVETKEGYLVNFAYGRVGTTLKEGTKTATPESKEKALKIYEKLIKSKKDKGYKEKQLRVKIELKEYKERLLNRLQKALDEKLIVVDNYQVSRLIYRAGEIRLYRAKEIIENIYKLNLQLKEEHINVFYFSIVYSLGRIDGDKNILLEIRDILSDSSKYIVDEALKEVKYINLDISFNILNRINSNIVKNKEFLETNRDEVDKKQSKILTIEYQSQEKFLNQNQDIKNLREELNQIARPTYSNYYNSDYYKATQKLSLEMDKQVKIFEKSKQEFMEKSYWLEKKEKKRLEEELIIKEKELKNILNGLKNSILTLISNSIINNQDRELLIQIIPTISINQDTFLLFRRLYKVAEFRDDYRLLSQTITKIEATKMSCYEILELKGNNEWNNKRSIGCSKLYFKKRALRYIKDLELEPNRYILFAKELLVSLNHYKEEFKSFKVEKYDYDSWSYKKKYYDAFSTHIVAFYILFANSKRYKLANSKKLWETKNKSIKDEIRVEANKEFWNENPKEALEILIRSQIEEVQRFAFNILKEYPKVVEEASLKEILPLINLSYQEAKEFFVDMLKNRYKETKEREIIEAFLVGVYEDGVKFAIDEIEKTPTILSENLFIKTIDSIENELLFEKVLLLVKYHLNQTSILDKVLEFNFNNFNRVEKIFNSFIEKLEIKHIEILLEDEPTKKTLLALKLIRTSNLKIPLNIKEKIARGTHPQMIATTLYFLGEIEKEELQSAYKMIVSFLFNENKDIRKEAKNLLTKINPDIKTLQAIIDNSFKSVKDDVIITIEQSIKLLKPVFNEVEPNQLYRLIKSKSKLANSIGVEILQTKEAKIFSNKQWIYLAKNQNKRARTWSYKAFKKYKNSIEMPLSLMLFDTHWEDTRDFAKEYFKEFDLTQDEIIVIADSNFKDVQDFAKELIEKENRNIIIKLAQHPSKNIQNFISNFLLELKEEEILNLEEFFNTILFSINSQKVAKQRILYILNKNLKNKEIGKIYANLAINHSLTFVWADKTLYIEAMRKIKEYHKDIKLPIEIIEPKELEYGV